MMYQKIIFIFILQFLIFKNQQLKIIEKQQIQQRNQIEKHRLQKSNRFKKKFKQRKQDDYDDYDSYLMDTQGLKSDECQLKFDNNTIDVAWRNNKANYNNSKIKLTINLFIDCLCYFQSLNLQKQNCNEKKYFLNTCSHPEPHYNYYDYVEEDSDGTYFYKRFTSDQDQNNNQIKCQKHCINLKIKYSDTTFTCYQRLDQIVDQTSNKYDDQKEDTSQEQNKSKDQEQKTLKKTYVNNNKKIKKNQEKDDYKKHKKINKYSLEQ